MLIREILTDRGRYKVEQTPSGLTDCDCCDWAPCADCPLMWDGKGIGYFLLRVSSIDENGNEKMLNQK